jgi:hypothetical protein
LLIKVLLITDQIRVIHNQNQHQVITRLTDRVQLITEVQAQEHHQEVTVHLLQIQEVTEAVHHRQVVAEATITAVAGAAEEAAVLVHIPGVQVVALQAVVHPAAVAVDHVLQVVVRLLQVAGKKLTFRNLILT